MLINSSDIHVHYCTRRFFPDLYGGIEVSSWQLVKKLVELNVRVTVTCENRSRNCYSEDWLNCNIRCVRIPDISAGTMWRFGRFGRIARWALEFANKPSGDLVLATNPECVIAARLAMPSSLIVYRLISVTPNVLATLGHPSSNLQYCIERLAASMANRIIVETTNVAEQACSCFLLPASRVCVIPTGVDTLRFSPCSPTSSQNQSESLRIVSVGRLHREKGHDFLIRAMSLQSHAQKAHLTLVGDGPELGQLKRLVHQLGMDKRVVFAGKIDHPENVLRQSNILVIASICESYGTSLVEGMATGLTCLARKAAPPLIRNGFAELIEHGKTGILFDANDPSDLARWLDVLTSQPELRLRIGQAAAATARQRFSLDHMALDYLQLIRNAMVQHSKKWEN